MSTTALSAAREALRASAASADELYRGHVNPQRVWLLVASISMDSRTGAICEAVLADQGHALCLEEPATTQRRDPASHDELTGHPEPVV
jgi:hypothetical protein